MRVLRATISMGALAVSSGVPVDSSDAGPVCSPGHDILRIGVSGGIHHEGLGGARSYLTSPALDRRGHPHRLLPGVGRPRRAGGRDLRVHRQSIHVRSPLASSGTGSSCGESLHHRRFCFRINDLHQPAAPRSAPTRYLCAAAAAPFRPLFLAPVSWRPWCCWAGLSLGSWRKARCPR